MSVSKKQVEDIKKSLLYRRRPKIISHNLLSTGVSTLNCACSGKPWGGLSQGHIYLSVGDSGAGKTFEGMTILAEASLNPAYANHRLIYDGPEDGALMDEHYFFGKALAERIERLDPPSSTIEEYIDNVKRALKDGKPFIWLLDSLDSLTSEQELDKFDQQRRARATGKKIVGSFGDGKAKKNSSGLRILHNRLKNTESMIIMICQTRDNLGFGFQEKTRSGGHAPTLYATMEFWWSILGKIKRTVNEKGACDWQDAFVQGEEEQANRC
jgi:RecA/RadA recombinase